MSERRIPCPRQQQRGAALLLAMVILTLVATLAGGMVWQQWRAVEVEAAQRARSQSEWILIGALDWARLILAEDGRNNRADDLGEPWATPLAESRLSTFLAADQSNNAAAAEDGGIEAFLSGQIEDAQGRYNLRNLIDNTNKPVPAEVASLEKLCEFAGLSSQAAQTITTSLRSAWFAGPGAPEDAPVAPTRVADLLWLGLDEASLGRLRPWITLLPVRTPVNLNTAAPEVIAAVLPGMDLGSAQRLAEARRRKRFESASDFQPLLPATVVQVPTDRVNWISNYFFVSGRLRLGDRLVEETTLVRRNGREVIALQRERHSSHLGGR